MGKLLSATINHPSLRLEKIKHVLWIKGQRSQGTNIQKWRENNWVRQFQLNPKNRETHLSQEAKLKLIDP